MQSDWGKEDQECQHVVRSGMETDSRHCQTTTSSIIYSEPPVTLLLRLVHIRKLYGNVQKYGRNERRARTEDFVRIRI